MAEFYLDVGNERERNGKFIFSLVIWVALQTAYLCSIC